jgi:hypothetical protein
MFLELVVFGLCLSTPTIFPSLIPANGVSPTNQFSPSVFFSRDPCSTLGRPAYATSASELYLYDLPVSSRRIRNCRVVHKLVAERGCVKLQLLVAFNSPAESIGLICDLYKFVCGVVCCHHATWLDS